MLLSIRYKWVGLLLLVLLTTFLESCRVKRCPLDNCHIRMRHRHPSMMRGGSDGVVYDPNAGDESALGPVYRGVPWWQAYRKDNKMRQGTKTHQRVSMRDPKIGQGYKPGYKYKHKDNTPAWSERIVKYKKKKIEDDEKAERKAAREEEKKARKGDSEADTPDGDQTEADTTPDEMKLFGGEQPADGGEAKKERKQRKAKAKREKKEKPKKEDKPKEESEETEAEKDDF
ncbi:MAG: hypothetical protein MUD08_04605 [Cytophagales bacterium]|jgi:hypothetical protein|nr:hypothetical protein [Cytophagales bacterium]